MELEDLQLKDSYIANYNEKSIAAAWTTVELLQPFYGRGMRFLLAYFLDFLLPWSLLVSLYGVTMCPSMNGMRFSRTCLGASAYSMLWCLVVGCGDERDGSSNSRFFDRKIWWQLGV
ncbi:hypothetical protein BCR42DRAFT_390807 [Absidia repens]|uniref:Uncharacterized protein n=1 Tax=Absidia repens TaxID=90262 RepID=A0A1X2ILP7_9FUNG|nr:hypothetical protein BCR42DRAFT_390807 [Absidia repens]